MIVNVIKSNVRKTKRGCHADLSLCFCLCIQKDISFFLPLSSMAFTKALQMILIILMVASIPLLLSSRTSDGSGLLGETAMAQESSTMAKELRSYYWFNRFGRRGAFIVGKRQVPTGPDPLHHNSNPTRPSP